MHELVDKQAIIKQFKKEIEGYQKVEKKISQLEELVPILLQENEDLKASQTPKRSDKDYDNENNL